MLGALMHEHQIPLLAQALRLTGGDRAWAEDVVQETFIRAWRRIDRMTAEHGSVRGWLTRVTHNLVIDGYRSASTSLLEPTELEALWQTQLQDADGVFDDVLSAILVTDALASLSERHRVVLKLIYLQDHTTAEAAQALNLPVGTVKSRTFYALRRLRHTMTHPTDAMVSANPFTPLGTHQ